MNIGDTVFIHMIANVGKLTNVGKSLKGMPIMQMVVAEARIVETDSGTLVVEPIGGGHNTPWERTEDKWWLTRSGAQLALAATIREGTP